METVEVINRKECGYSEKPNNSDTISRHAAIRWIKTECNPYGKPTLDYETSCRIMEHLDKMPSAQPEPCGEMVSREVVVKFFDDWMSALDINCHHQSVADLRIIKGDIKNLPSAQPDESKYEYHYDHTDCIWYRPEARNRCPVTCAQYRDGWNDAMNYIFRDGKGYKPYRRDKQYGE